MAQVEVTIFQALLIRSFFGMYYCDANVQLLNFMNIHEEILVVADTISSQIKGNASSAVTSRSSSQYQLSFVNATLNSDKSNGIQFDSINGDKPLRVLVDLKSVSQTVDFVSRIDQFQDGGVLKNDSDRTWILVIWPETIEAASKTLGLKTTTNLDSQLVSSILRKHLESTPFVTNINIESQFYIGFLRENIPSVVSSAHDLMRFYEVYGLNGQLVVTEVDSLGDIFVNCVCLGQTSRRSDLRGILLRVEGLEDPEFQNDTDYMTDKNGQIKLIRGFSVDIFKILQQALNFTSTVTITNSSAAHVMNESSSWDAIIQRTEKGEVDVGLSLTVHLEGRAKRVYFLPPTDEYIVSAFFKQPSANAVRDIFMQPFHVDLWAAVVATWLILAFSMIMFSVIRKRAGVVSDCGPDQVEPDFTQNSFIWALATACQQGWDEHPVAGSLRTIFISGSFTGVVAYAGYSAAIVSTLSLRIDPIQTPDALVDSNLRIGVRVGFLDKILADRTRNDIVSRIYRRLTKKPNEALVNVSRGHELLETSPYAFISIRDTFYDTVTQFKDDKDICLIRDLSILQHGFPAGSFLSRNSPYKEYFRAVIAKIRERGVVWRLRNFYLYKRRCSTSAGSEGQVLGPADVFTAFMILLGGYAISFCILLIERVYFRRLNSQVTW